MFLSFFDIFKIGSGPSSSHTMGPMTDAAAFLAKLTERSARGDLEKLRASLHGSLAFTGKGHASDRAVTLRLAGFLPATLDPDIAEEILARLKDEPTLQHPALGPLSFDAEVDVVFDYDEALRGHANGMRFVALGVDCAELFSEAYYSIGGGFVVTEAELEAQRAEEASSVPEFPKEWNYPHPFVTTTEMLRMGQKSGKTIADMKYENEVAHLDQAPCATSAPPVPKRRSLEDLPAFLPP